jgi:hypothetical protein
MKIEFFADTQKALGQINGFLKQIASDTAKTSKKTSSSFDEITKSVVFLNQGIELASKVFGKMAGSMDKVIKAAVVQENAINDLNNALMTTGKFTKSASTDLQKYSSELQSVTTFGDEALLSAMSLGVALADLSGKQLKDATLAAANLSARMGIDLNTAMELISKSAITGGTNLRRYGISVEKGATQAEDLSNAITKINKQFAGAAESKVKTYAGAMQSLTNVWGDLLEIQGQSITQNPVVLNGIETLKTALLGLSDFFESQKLVIIEYSKILVVVFADLLEYFNQFLEQIWPAIEGVASFLKTIATAVAEIRKMFILVVGEIIDQLSNAKSSFALWEGFRRTIDTIAGGLKTGIGGGLYFIIKRYIQLAKLLGIEIPDSAKTALESLDALTKDGINQVNNSIDLNTEVLERNSDGYSKIDGTIKKLQTTLRGLTVDNRKVAQAEGSRAIASVEASNKGIELLKKYKAELLSVGETLINAFSGAAASIVGISKTAQEALDSLTADTDLANDKIKIDYEANIEKIKVGDALNFEGIDKKLSDTAAAIATNKAKAVAKVYADLNAKLSTTTTLGEKEKLQEEAQKLIDKINRDASSAISVAEIEAANEKTAIATSSQIELQKAEIDHQAELNKNALDSEKKRQDIIDKAEKDRQKLFEDTAFNIIKGTGSLIAEAFLPGAGKFVGPLLDILNAGGAAASEMIEKTFEQIPLIIDKLVQASPQIIQSLSTNLPKLSASLVTALVKSFSDPKFVAALIEGIARGFVGGVFEGIKGIGNVIYEFAKSQFNIGKWLVDGIMEAFAAAGNFLQRVFKFDGGGKGTVENFLGFDFPWVAFAKGGQVGGNARTSGDSKLNDIVPALLSPGEVVIPRSAMNQGAGGIVSFLQGLGVMPQQLGFGGFAKGILGSVGSAVGSVVNTVVDVGKNIFGGIVGAADFLIPGNLKGLYDSLLKFGKSINIGNFIANPIDESKRIVASAVGSFQPNFQKMLSLSQGGQVFGGRVGVDSIPARLTPGELVVDRTTTGKLQNFLEQESGSDVTNALLLQIIQLLKKDTNIETKVEFDRATFAEIMLKLSRNNQRLTA